MANKTLQDVNKTLQDVIDDFDDLNFNAYSNEQKTSWINELEKKVQTEILKTYPGTPLKQYDYADDQDTELLIDPAYEELYGMYLACKVSYSNMDWMTYDNEKSMFNLRYTEYADFHKRNNIPAQPTSIKNTWG